MEVSNSHHQAMAAHQLEQVLAGFNCPNKPIDPHHQHHHQQQQGQQQQEKKVRPPNPPERALKCPRCESSNTKFCYYNNYSLSQPRYFCKGCRRYWTQGGSLRNVPVGGGCRKNKRSSSSSSSSSSKNKPQSLTTTTTANNSNSNPVLFRPPLSYDPSVDLSLPFTSNTPFLNPNPNPSAAAGFLDILRGGGGFHQNGYSNNNALSSYYVDDQACADVLPPFEGANGLAGTTTSATAGEGSWINHGNNVAVDSTRGYWNGGVGSYWHGLINSSLM